VPKAGESPEISGDPIDSGRKWRSIRCSLRANAHRPRETATIETPYLLFLGDAPDMLAAKVAIGIRDWRPENALGQIRLPGCGADLGLADMTLAEARAAGAKTLVIGVANRGGVISPAWKKVLIEALETGYDLASGLHNLLRDEGDLVAAAQTHGGTLHDVRVPTVGYPIANGVKRTGKRCLAVGTDCSVGKMYTAMAMEAEMAARGIKATFRATGQTGILITGHGVPLDAVIDTCRARFPDDTIWQGVAVHLDADSQPQAMTGLLARDTGPALALSLVPLGPGQMMLTLRRAPPEHPRAALSA